MQLTYSIQCGDRPRITFNHKVAFESAIDAIVMARANIGCAETRQTKTTYWHGVKTERVTFTEFTNVDMVAMMPARMTDARLDAFDHAVKSAAASPYQHRTWKIRRTA